MSVAAAAVPAPRRRCVRAGGRGTAGAAPRPARRRCAVGPCSSARLAPCNLTAHEREQLPAHAREIELAGELAQLLALPGPEPAGVPARVAQHRGDARALLLRERLPAD